MRHNTLALLSVLLPLIAIVSPAGADTHLTPDTRVDVPAVRATIADLGLGFTVEENRFTSMTAKERLAWSGAMKPAPVPGFAPPPRLAGPRDGYLDWRDVAGASYVSGVRDQGGCGSCWAFASVAMLESSLMIALAAPDTDPDYSEQYLLSCIDDAGWPDNDCTGGYMHEANAFLEQEGAPTEICFPYTASAATPCGDACFETPSELRRFASSSWVTQSTVDLQAIKDALADGPVGTWFQIWNSFYGYDEGIYSAYGSAYSGANHFVLIVGYDDANQCWIAKNSWSANWGEEGFFRIAYDSGCGFGRWTRSCVYDDSVAPIAVIEPDAYTVWRHGQTDVTAQYSGSTGTAIRVDVFRSGIFVDEFLPWTAEAGGTLTRSEAIPAAWGFGDDFQLHFENDAGQTGWSVPFFVEGSAEWEELTAPPLDDAGAGYSAGCPDVDGDGDCDLYLANKNQANRLLLNDGAGGFVDATAPPLDVTGNSRGQAWGDADNDGDPDLYLAMTSGQSNRFFENLGGGGFADATAPPLDDASYSWGVAWGDYDADGLPDLYIGNAYAADRLLRNGGGGAFTDATAGPLGSTGYGRAPVWTDYDGDGDLDLYMAINGNNALYENRGAGVFAAAFDPVLCDAGNGYGGAWGDYDDDGDLDLYLVNEGPNRLLRNDGGGVFTDVTAEPLANDADGRGAVWFDYDNDGRLDLFIVNQGGNLLCRNQGDGVFLSATSPLLAGSGNSNGVACADYDGDGRLDLYVVNNLTPNRLLRNVAGAGRHWVAFRLAGGPEGASALGARVRIVAGGQARLREIGSDAAGLSQSSLDVEFGLGDAERIDSLEIRWPDGRVTTRRDLAADRVYAISQSGTAVADAAAPYATALLGGHPNPFNPETRVAFTLAEAGPARLTIHDLSGRRVATLVEGELSAGRHEIAWDGRTGRGGAAASGVYFARLEAGQTACGRKLVLIR